MSLSLLEVLGVCISQSSVYTSLQTVGNMSQAHTESSYPTAHVSVIRARSSTEGLGHSGPLYHFPNPSITQLSFPFFLFFVAPSLMYFICLSPLERLFPTICDPRLCIFFSPPPDSVYPESLNFWLSEEEFSMSHRSGISSDLTLAYMVT